MAVHARLRGRNVGDGRNLDRGVTVPAIETELADVELVAVRDGLNGTVAHVRVPRGKVVPDARDRKQRNEAARDGGHDRELVPPRGKDLGQWLELRGAGGQFQPGLPRLRVRNGVMQHPRAPKNFSQETTGMPSIEAGILSTNSDLGQALWRTGQTFSKASDSASLGSRSGTSACRRISQVAAATKHPPTASRTLRRQAVTD